MSADARDKNKCVCFVSLEIHPTTPGGAGILVRHTITLLLEQGYDIVLLLDVQSWEFQQFLDTDKFTFPNADRLYAYSVEQLNVGGVPIATGLNDSEYRRSIRIARALQALSVLHDIAFVEFYDYCGPSYHYLALPDLNLPKVAVRLHNTIEFIHSKIGSPLSQDRIVHFSMERAQINLADAMLASGPAYFEEEMISLYPTIDTERSLVSSPVFAPIGCSVPAADARDVLFYGRLSTFKGLDVFLQGVALALQNDTFRDKAREILIVGPEETVAGSLSLDEMLSVIPRDHMDRVSLIGRVNHKALLHLLDRTMFAAFANKAESFCYAAHEIHTAGVPIIVRDAPAFRDHFVEGETALFFDGSAMDLASKMIAMDEDANLRDRLARAGRARGSSYRVNHYDQHLAAVSRRRAIEGNPLSISALIFSCGDLEEEARTRAALSNCCLNVSILRADPDGWDISGARFAALTPGAEEASASLLPVGRAVIGFRAGDVPDAGWIAEAAELMGRDQKVAAVACWTQDRRGPRTGVDHVIPENALWGQQGLRRLIRVPRGMVLAELVARMKAAGEVGLILSAREKGGTVLESPRVGVDTTHAVRTPGFDIGGAIEHEHRRMDPNWLALRRSLSGDVGESGHRDDGTMAAAVQADRCVIRGRPDIRAGEVRLMRVFAQEGAGAAPHAAIDFSAEWTPRADEANTMVTFKGGWASFDADHSAAVELFFGPLCGACEIMLNGKRRIIELRADRAESVIVRLDALLEDRWDGPAPRTLVEHAGPLQVNSAEPLLVSSASVPALPESTAVLIANKSGWAFRRSGVGASSGTVVETREVLGAAGDNTRGAVDHLRNLLDARGGGHLVIAPEGPGDLDLAEALATLAPAIDLTVLMTPGMGGAQGPGGYAADAAAAARLSKIARSASRPPRFASPDDGLLSLFGALGAETSSLGALPGRPDLQVEAHGPLRLAILGTSRLVPSRAHLVAAAVHVRQRGTPFESLIIPQGDDQSAKVAEALGIRTIETFADPTELHRLSGPGPSVALCAYPDPVAPDACHDALQAGFIPITGLGGLWANDEELRRFQVEYWEDAEEIAKTVETVLGAWAEACRVMTAGAAVAEARALDAAGALLAGGREQRRHNSRQAA